MKKYDNLIEALIKTRPNQKDIEKYNQWYLTAKAVVMTVYGSSFHMIELENADVQEDAEFAV